MTYSKEQRKKFLMEYLSRLIDHIEIKPGKEGLIEVRDALNIEIFTYEHQEFKVPYGISLADLLNN